MSTVDKLHREAMEFLDSADLLRRRGTEALPPEALRRLQKDAGDADVGSLLLWLMREALRLEKQAAGCLSATVDAEPTRSVLLRSAASIAHECGDFREAERLIAQGLAGDPPDEIAEELRDLYEQVNFERHLGNQGIFLEPNELRLALSGKMVGYGHIYGREFTKRFDTTQALAYRTYQRLRDQPYKDAGTVNGSVRENCELIIRTPQAASFAVALKVGRTNEREQLELPGFFQPITGVVDEMLACLELFEEARHDELKERISDEAYFNNFRALARKLAPDGERVTQVGFTVVRADKIRRFALRKPSSTWKGFVQAPTPSIEPIEFFGYLHMADRRESTDHTRMILVDEQGEEITFNVPQGLLDDIVGPLWGQHVTVVGLPTKKAGVYDLEEIIEGS